METERTVIAVTDEYVVMFSPPIDVVAHTIPDNALSCQVAESFFYEFLKNLEALIAQVSSFCYSLPIRRPYRTVQRNTIMRTGTATATIRLMSMYSSLMMPWRA